MMLGCCVYSIDEHDPWLGKLMQRESGIGGDPDTFYLLAGLECFYYKLSQTSPGCH
jgi:hypothetical protein